MENKLNTNVYVMRNWTNLQSGHAQRQDCRPCSCKDDTKHELEESGTFTTSLANERMATLKRLEGGHGIVLDAPGLVSREHKETCFLII